ncbi:MAG: redox-regulated ATPase YchF [Nanoarchaeota archaeon]|nr:redox-regulated ATPase YchF [Nanoarchaeota archaeon]MBU1988577.1 redox-regulated ATPase YchF [Nanoarchaeota archaeon]
MLIGLIGRPNSGKSTFFKAATLSDVLIANYPFATIKPNHGMAYVKILDLAPEFNKVSNPREGYVKGPNGKFRFVPFELMDVAGLVEGASEGKGLGNEFLNNLAGADAFIHVVDMSGETDAEGKPTKDYYPGQDLKVIENELDKWYLGILMKVWKTFARKVEMQKQNLAEAVAKQFSGLKVSEEDVKDVVRKTSLSIEKPASWSPEQISQFAQALRKHTKPMVLACNKMDRPNAKENLKKIKEEFDYPLIPCFAESELALREADKHGLIEYIPGEKTFTTKGELNEKQTSALNEINSSLKEFSSTGIQEILNKTVFEILEYITIFPAGDKLEDSKGNVLPDCFLMKKGSTALDFAYLLHTDIGDNFIKAVDVRTKRAVGKEYILKHRDGFEIMVK